MPYENGIWRPHDWRDWEIELIDSSLDTIGLLDEAVGAKIKWGLYGHGDGSLALHIDSDRAADLLTDAMYYFRFYRDGVQIRDFMLSKDDRGYTVQNQRIDEYIEIALAPLDAILRDKLCLVLGGTEFASPASTLDDGFKWIVDHVCGPSAYNGPGGSSRALAGLTIAADESAHPTTDSITQAHKMDLFEFLQKFGPTWDIDWRVRMAKTTGVANEMIFETFYPGRGLDKTRTNGARQPILINDASGEVRQARRYRPATGFINVVMAKDLGSEVKDATSVTAYGRRELIADVNDAEKLAALLESRKQRVGYELSFSESEMLSVGTGTSDEGQFQPGDEVSIASEHLDVAERDEFVKEIELAIVQGGAEQASLTFGEYEKTLVDKVKEFGTGGGGGGGGGSYFDPIEGLKDNAGLFVPFSNDDDYIWVKLVAGSGITTTGNVGANTITIAASLAEGDLPTHDIITKHSYTGGAALDVFGLSAANTIAKLTPSSNPGAAAAILCSTSAGYLTLVRVTAKRLAITAAEYIDATGSYLRLYAGDRVIVKAADVGIEKGRGIIHADASATGQVLRYDGTRFIPAKLAITDMSATHKHTVSITSKTNSNFTNRGISEESGYANQIYIYVSSNADGSSPRWSKCCMSDGTHTHVVSGDTGLT